MSRKFLTPIDLSGLELQNAVIQNLSSAPTAAKGRIFFDSTNSALKVSLDGSTFSTLSTGGGSFTLGSTSISLGGTTTSVSGLTLGSSSVWNGNAVGVAYGGTGTSTGSITGTGALTFTSASGNNNVNLVPTGSGTVDVASKRITNLADPTGDQDAATKKYVDNVSLGVNAHDAVVALISGTIAGSYTAGSTGADGGTGVGAYITYTATGATTVDTSVTLAQYDRVLVNGGVTADSGTGSKANGIYIVSTAGTTGVATVLTRALDFDNSIFGDVTSGDLVYVTSGSAWGGTQWVQTTKGTATTGSGASTRYCVKIDTDAITFTQFSGVSSTTAGAGLIKNGNAFDVGAGTGITVNAEDIAINTSIVPRLGVPNVFTVGAQEIDIATTTDVGLTIKGAASQSGNLQNWINSSSTVLASISSVGTIYGARLQINIGTNIAAIGVQTSSGGTQIGAAIRGAAAQSVSLQEWQNSSGTALAKVDQSGNVTAVSFVKTSGTSSQFLKADGSVDSSTYLTSSGAVTSLAGTTNQIAASASTGSVTLSLPSAVTISGAMTAGSFVKSGGTSTQFLMADGSTTSPTIPGKASGTIALTANVAGTITHNLGTRAVIVQMYESSASLPTNLVDMDVTSATTNTVTVTAQTSATYYYVVMG